MRLGVEDTSGGERCFGAWLSVTALAVRTLAFRAERVPTGGSSFRRERNIESDHLAVRKSGEEDLSNKEAGPNS